MARAQAVGTHGGGGTYLGHITAQPDQKSVNKVWAEAWRLWRRVPRPGER